MPSFFRAPVAVLVMLFCLGGCGSKNPGSAQDITAQDFSLDRAAAIRIADPCGSISIRGSDSGGLRLRTTKKSGTSEQLKNIGVTVSAQHDDFAIRTTLLRQKGKPFFGTGDSVDYALTVPRTVKIQRLEVDNGDISLEGLEEGEVQAHIVDGRLAVKNCYGNIRLAVQNGALELAYDRPDRLKSTITARVLTGSARLVMSGSAAFHIVAETPVGSVTNKLGAMVEVNGRPLRKADFSFGKPPRSEVQIQVMIGNVSIVGPARDTASVAAVGGR